MAWDDVVSMASDTDMSDLRERMCTHVPLWREQGVSPLTPTVSTAAVKIPDVKRWAHGTIAHVLWIGKALESKWKREKKGITTNAMADAS